MIIRTQEEILEKWIEGFNEDLFDNARSAIMFALSIENVKKIMRPEIFEVIKNNETRWEHMMYRNKRDVLAEIIKRIDFGHKIVNKHSALTALKNVCFIRGLVWLIDDSLFHEVEDEFSNRYSKYGLNILRCVKKGIKKIMETHYP